jgi:ribokinase
MRPHIVVVGSTMLDLMSYADRVPTQGQTITGSRFVFGHGGKGANQAVMAARLDADVTFVSRVGDDLFGRLALQNLADHGLAPDHVRAVENESTGVASIWVEADGHNRILIVPGANLSLTAADVATELEHAAAPDCVICQLEISLDAVKAALQWGRDRGAVTILNPAPAASLDRDLLELADWLTPNEGEFRTLFDADPGDDAALIAVAAASAGRLIVTLGAEGAATVIDGEVVRFAPPSVSPIDTTGAGDAFMGGLAYALSRGDSLADAILLGNRCGAVSTTSLGTQPSFPNADQVSAQH